MQILPPHTRAVYLGLERSQRARVLSEGTRGPVYEALVQELREVPEIGAKRARCLAGEEWVMWLRHWQNNLYYIVNEPDHLLTYRQETYEHNKLMAGIFGALGGVVLSGSGPESPKERYMFTPSSIRSVRTWVVSWLDVDVKKV
jgi:hypothetical protein